MQLPQTAGSVEPTWDVAAFLDFNQGNASTDGVSGGGRHTLTKIQASMADYLKVTVSMVALNHNVARERAPEGAALLKCMGSNRAEFGS